MYVCIYVCMFICVCIYICMYVDVYLIHISPHLRVLSSFIETMKKEKMEKEEKEKKEWRKTEQKRAGSTAWLPHSCDNCKELVHQKQRKKKREKRKKSVTIAKRGFPGLLHEGTLACTDLLY